MKGWLALTERGICILWTKSLLWKRYRDGRHDGKASLGSKLYQWLDLKPSGLDGFGYETELLHC